MRTALLPLLFAGAALAQHADVRDEDLKNPYADKPEAVDSGRRLYLISCSGCHGPTGEGGRGIRLLGNGAVREASNRRLLDAMKNGVRGSDMPPSTLPDDSLWQIIVFVKAINASAYDSKPPGDAATGEGVFDGRGGCRGCHMVGGTGGKLGPDLSNAGVAHSLAELRESILQPSERPTEGFGGVAVTRKGSWIEGVAKDNTNYSITVMDLKGQLHRIAKIDVVEIVFKKKSVMPDDFGEKLSKQELNDLLSYLSRQAVRAPAKQGKEAK